MSNLKCAKCGCRIKPGQLYIAKGPRHVACPNEREIAHAKRMDASREGTELDTQDTFGR
jgi:hypothetical protein